MRVTAVLLALLFAAPPLHAEEAPLVLQQLACRGADPAWTLEANRTTALVTRGEDGRDEAIHRGALVGLDDLDPPWASFRGSANEAGDVLVLTVRAEACERDGERFDHRALVSFPDGTVASGCCRGVRALDIEAAPRAEPSAKPPADWSRWAPDLAVAIRSCVIDGGLTVATIPVAWPMNHGLAGVRLETTDGTRHDCIADLATGRIERVVKVDADDRQPLEGEPVLYPARDAPPILGCGRAERLADPASGALLGVLHYGGPCPPAPPRAKVR
ncbi:MAG: hypothetical protein ACOC3D_09955 [Pseudomonadota bacterium]